jgi:hypothetical protein
MATTPLIQSAGGNSIVISTTTTPDATAPGVVVRSVGTGEVGLRSDDAASHGAYTLSATPGTVTSITIPAGAHIAVLSDANARIDWNINADPVVAGTNAQTAGSSVAALEREAIILRDGAATLRLSSTTESASVRVAFRGVAV